MSDPTFVGTRAPVERFVGAIAEHRPVLVADDPDALDPEIVARLLAAVDRPGVATASPIPVASAVGATVIDLHPAAPPAPSLPLPCRRLCVVGSAALTSLTDLPAQGISVEDLVVELAERLLQHGWRHVAAPGVALGWQPREAAGIHPTAGWTERTVESLAGTANPGLEATVSWASAQLDGVRVVVDGACLTDAPFTGTQHLVVEIARWLATTRPDRRVLLAAPRNVADAIRGRLADTTVEVVGRETGLDADVVYRPYQMLYAHELDFVVGTGRRGLVGQLDMIGFANPFYHPSEQLLFFARNLQRHLMRTLDGVTFISAFGRDSTVAEVPDLERERLHVVSCGADPRPIAGQLGPNRTVTDDTELLVCLSSTFWHKNRSHAIATFAELVASTGFGGELVIGGPEPYFGRSTDAEDALLASLPADVARRVHRWGHVTDEEKWWLLRHARAVLYPSVIEGFGLVPFEAAAVGTPCLAHAGTAPGELLGATGAVIRDWSPSAWAERVASWLADPRAAQSVVDAVGGVAGDNTWERCAIRTWDAIDHALATPRRILHADDGGALARVAPGAGGAGTVSLRFQAARGVPAVRRRVLAATRRLRGDRT